MAKVDRNSSTLIQDSELDQTWFPNLDLRPTPVPNPIWSWIQKISLDPSPVALSKTVYRIKQNKKRTKNRAITHEEEKDFRGCYCHLPCPDRKWFVDTEVASPRALATMKFKRESCATKSAHILLVVLIFSPPNPLGNKCRVITQKTSVLLVIIRPLKIIYIIVSLFLWNFSILNMNTICINHTNSYSSNIFFL